MTFGASIFLAHYLDSAHEKKLCLGNLILVGFKYEVSLTAGFMSFKKESMINAKIWYEEWNNAKFKRNGLVFPQGL